MKNQYKATAAVRVLVVLFTLHCSLIPASAKENYGYTKDHPLVIVSDWDFQPFEYLDTDGKPAGFNVDVLNLILDNLGIPHKFVMQEWYLATRMFEHREADLIHARTSSSYNTEPYTQTKKYVNYYPVAVARRVNMPPLVSIKNLGENDVLLMKNNDYAALTLKEMHNLPFSIEYHSPKDALANIRSGRYKYFVWGEIPLASKIKELNLDSIVLDDIDIAAGELCINGYNKKLVDIIDDEFTRLEQNGELDAIRDKWFHPEKDDGNVSMLVYIILAALAAAGLLFFLLARLISVRVRKAVRELADVNNIMTTALSMDDYHVVSFDVVNHILHNLYGHLLSSKTMLPEDFLKRMTPEQAKLLHEKNLCLIRGEQQRFDIHILFNQGTADQPEWHNYYGNAIAETEDGRVTSIFYNVKDTTRELQEEKQDRDLWNKYMQLFDTNIVAMSFYDKNGVMLDFNQKMRELCGINDTNEAHYRGENLFDVSAINRDFPPGCTESLHCCHLLHFPLFGIDKYIEMRVKPVFDDGGDLSFYIVTARDVSDERTMYLEQVSNNERIKLANETINKYEDQLHYLLQQTNMFIWYYDPATKILTYTRSPHEERRTETFEEFFAGVPADEREEAMEVVYRCITEDKPFNIIHHYDYTPLEPHPVWYAISGVPSFDAEGRVIEYYGVARNITDLMEAQEKLKEETARAEDSGRLKAAFLANMTHEIRTPLNAIVGFSDILQMVESPAERNEFIRIIRNNCDMLLRLINDILEASSMGQALAIEPVPCDFAQVFDDICQTLEQRVAEAGVPFIKDNPYTTFPAVLDKGRIQQILTNFTTNAVKYTKTGHIKVGYRAQDNGIYFYCEDTGAGIPKEKQEAVFERFVKLNDFVQGTGLGLSICKAIADSCDGKIGVTSEGEGQGSTFWFWLPQAAS